MSGAIGGLLSSFSIRPTASLVMNLDATVGAMPGSNITTSASFDGSTQRLSTTGSLATGITEGTNMGTGNFTWECWVRATANVGYGTFIDTRGSKTGYSAVDTDGVYFGLDNNTLYPTYFQSTALITSSIALTVNTWTHVAVIRNSGTTTLYVGGVSGGTYVDNLDLSAPYVNIGGGATYSDDFAGQISNLRMVKGTAVYTAGFVPPTTTLRAIAGTNLLLPLTATVFTDMSSNLLAITNTGTVITTAQAPTLAAATTDFTGTYTITTTNAGATIAYSSANGGVFRKSTSLGTDSMIVGPNYVTSQSYTVFMAYKISATSAGRLLNTNSEASKDWLFGAYNGYPKAFYPNFSVNLPGSGADTVWHFAWGTFNTGTSLGQLYTATSTQPTSTSFTGTNSGGGGFNQLRLFSRSGGVEVQTADIGMIRVYNGVVTLAQVQSQYAAFKARFGY
ncbi:LamG domain-containing protein [Haliscomenobacter sp.]|uniref:LamG domain-containing protein n=1 Tax=Haliscomenobacter sp. TaxID=2717303 RepID=UPI003364C469